MAVEIESVSGHVLYVAKDARNVREALEQAVAARADLTGANLAGTNLTGADLTGADLTGADLTGADLTGANLTGAYLTGAYLTGAHGVNPYRVNYLLMLRDQPGKVRAYKLVDSAGRSPIHVTGRIRYKVGETYSVTDADTSDARDCGAGINLATLPWCLKHYQPGYRIFVAEFTAKDIAAIPNSDGKFRVHRCRIAAEKNVAELL